MEPWSGVTFWSYILGVKAGAFGWNAQATARMKKY